MAELGWHLQLWIDVKDLPETIPVLKALGLPVVIDHMGRTDARAGTGTAGFQSLLRAVGDGWCWAKLSGAHRLSRDAPDYPDARPFHEALVAANPERLVWGGDWPHPRVEGEMPDAGHLFELFQMWTPDMPTQHRILVDQSRKALWFFELKVPQRCPSTTSACSTSNIWRNEIYADILRARPDVRLDRLENESPEDSFGADPVRRARLSDRRGAR